MNTTSAAARGALVPAVRHARCVGSAARLSVGIAWGRAIRTDDSDDAAGQRPGQRAATVAVVRGVRPRRRRRRDRRRCYLLAVRARRDRAPCSGARSHSLRVGVVFGFPLFMGLAVVRVDAVHASVVTGILPLVTAALGAYVLAKRQRPLFWLLLGRGWCWSLPLPGGVAAPACSSPMRCWRWRCCSVRLVMCGRQVVGHDATRARDLVGAGAGTADHRACRMVDAAEHAGAAGRRGWALPTWRCFRCGSASSRGIAHWPSAALCASARCNCCSRSCRSWWRCRCSANRSTTATCVFLLAVMGVVFGIDAASRHRLRSTEAKP